MATYTIKDIEKISGIKAHTIRMWERRHSLVIPQRTDTNIRYYSDQDLKDILNISILNQNGFKISKIVELSQDQLINQVRVLLDNPKKYSNIIDGMLLSMLEIDESAFIKIFSECLEEFKFIKTVEYILFPFLERIGVLWQTGTINPAQEHFISNLMRQKIIVEIDKQSSQKKATKSAIIFFLPENELHELGLLFYSLVAREKDYEVVYLGASVPLTDLIKIQKLTNAKAFFSAHVAAIDKVGLEHLFWQYRETFPEIAFFVNGLQIKEHNPILPTGFTVISSVDVFKKALQQFSNVSKKCES